MSEETKEASAVQEEVQPQKATRRGPKKKKRSYVLETPYPLVNPFSGTRFTQHNEVEHDEDNWVKAQVEAGILKEI